MLIYSGCYIADNLKWRFQLTTVIPSMKRLAMGEGLFRRRTNASYGSFMRQFPSCPRPLSLTLRQIVEWKVTQSRLRRRSSRRMEFMTLRLLKFELCRRKGPQDLFRESRDSPNASTKYLLNQYHVSLILLAERSLKPSTYIIKWKKERNNTWWWNFPSPTFCVVAIRSNSPSIREGRREEFCCQS
jgi:hypothetical protein